MTYSFSKHNVDTNEPELGRLRVKSRSVANGEFATHLDGWLNKCDLDKKVKEVVLFSDRSSTVRASSSATERRSIRSGGRRCKSFLGLNFSCVTHRWFTKRLVRGRSNRPAGAKFAGVAQRKSAAQLGAEVVGSSPTPGTIRGPRLTFRTAPQEAQIGVQIPGTPPISPS